MFIHYYCTYCSYVYGHKRRVRRACDVLRVVLLSAISYIFFLMCCRVGMSVVASPCRGTGTANTELLLAWKGGKLKCTYARPRGRTNSGKVRCYLLGLHCTYLMAAAVLLGCSSGAVLCQVGTKPASAARQTTDTRDAAGRPSAPRRAHRVESVGAAGADFSAQKLG